MLNEPVQNIIPRLAGPSILSMLVTAIYNMADTFFVSQINTSASAAVGIIFSLMAMFQAMAFTIGMGAGNNIARLLGQGQDEEAARFAATGYFTELIAGALIAALGLLNLKRLVYLLGATDTIAPYAMSYASYILFGTPFIMASFGMNNMLRFQGNSFYSMIGITAGGILNMILDPILIYGLKLGIAGAAIATAFSQFVSFVILTCQCNFMPACITIRFRNFTPRLSVYRRILYIGMPSMARQGVASLASVVMNHAAHPYGDAAIAAIAIVNRFAMFVNSAVIGFGQGFQPVCGFNFGAKKYRRVKEAYYFTLKVMTAILVTYGIISFVFARPIVTQFRREDPVVIEIGTLALRLQALTMPLVAQITLANMFTQTTGYGLRATFVAALRQGIGLMLFLLTLPPVFGLLGLQMAQPASDILSAVLSFLIVRGILKELDQKQREADAAEQSPGGA